MGFRLQQTGHYESFNRGGRLGGLMMIICKKRFQPEVYFLEQAVEGLVSLLQLEGLSKLGAHEIEKAAVGPQVCSNSGQNFRARA